jgi:phosphatidylinositol alpha-1,6-mannosyltransferase
MASRSSIRLWGVGRAVKLVMVTQDFPPATGGIQTYAAELAARFHRSEEDFVVIAPGAEGDRSWDDAAPYRVVRVGRSTDIVPLSAIPTLSRLGREGFDTVFHTQWQTVIATVSARRLGGPERLFLAAHGRELLLRPVERLPAMQGAYDSFRTRMIGEAKKLFPVSRFTAGLLRDLGADPKRMIQVPNGTDPERFCPMDASALKTAHGLQGRSIILSVGRVAPRKGFDTVIQALPQICAKVPDAVYVIVGDGPDSARLSALVTSLGLEDRVHRIGKVPWEDVPLWHNVADVFVTPSRSSPPSVEGFGIVFLEANACGKPVIGARTGGIPDAVIEGETGLLVEPDAPEALAEAILQLLVDRDLAARMGRQGRARVMREGTWDHVHATLREAMVGT